MAGFPVFGVRLLSLVPLWLLVVYLHIFRFSSFWLLTSQLPCKFSMAFLVIRALSLMSTIESDL